MFSYIFFDLDGTLIDSSEGITKAVQYSLKHFDIIVEDRKELEVFIGPPLDESFIKYYKLNNEQTNLAVKKYREYYSSQGVKENNLYKGIKQLLINLKNNNKTLVIATSKPTIFTEEILKIHNINSFFKFISGATLDGSRNKKGDIIKYALEEMKIIDTSECIMVGDKIQDVIGARLNNMDVIQVTYGFGTKEEIERAQPTYIANTCEEIEKICNQR